jgi:hypothetical protein
MGTTYRFIEEPRECSEVLAWFRNLPRPPHEHKTAHGVVLYFKELGPLVYDANGEVDASKCPVANIFLPQVRRGVLWTVGEVHLIATPLRQLYPELQKVSSRFSRWLSARECVFTSTIASNPYDYYLEGSVRNFDRPIFAFDSGLAALRTGRYFVASRDNDRVLDSVCRALSLRGVECAEA